jgi:hypothetical protein
MKTLLHDIWKLLQRMEVRNYEPSYQRYRCPRDVNDVWSTGPSYQFMQIKSGDATYFVSMTGTAAEGGAIVLVRDGLGHNDVLNVPMS